MSAYFVTAIGTDSGKTLVSAILCEALQADYWKPVQSGLPRDSETVRSLVPRPIKIHPEAYLLQTPASPHAAAKIDGVEISMHQIILPETKNNLIIEGAGGCMVPLNDNDLMVDLIKYLNLPVVLVSNLYLGSINHTLLTVEALRGRNILIKGIIFNGPPNAESERIILRHTQLQVLLRIQQEAKINHGVVKQYAQQIRPHFS